MMEKISRETSDLTQENIAKIAALFPDVVTEATDADGNVRLAIDFDALRDDLSSEVVDGPRERYQFTWPGKREAKLEARRPIKRTMRPCPEKSKDWDTTENLYIEGDNLEALKIMRETYAGKIKLIYIDPPYNTGNDFIYDDDFSKTKAEYDAESGDFDEEGGRLVSNPESNGRFHSDWCSMMYPRLLLARDLLSDDGSILISIDANEVKNLRAICDEVFGAYCFKNCIAVRRGIKNVQAQFDDIASLSQGHEYMLLYSKKGDTRFSKLMMSHGGKPGKWDTFWRGTDRPTMRYELFGETPAKGQWRWERGRAYEAADNYKSYLSKCASGITLDEYYLDHLTATNEKLNFVRKNDEGTVQYYVPPSTGKLLSDNWMDLTLSGSETGVFDTEKSVAIIERSVSWLTDADSIVLDFFSGSATTAHAVMCCNEKDAGRRRFIMVQLPEECDASSAARREGFSNICEIGEERIRHAGETIKGEIDKDNNQLELGTEPKPMPDIGFRVLRVDDSCLKDEYAAPDQYDQAQLDLFSDNAAEGAAPLDLLFQVLPAFRIEYSAKIVERELGGKACFDVNDGQLIACFDEDIDTEALEAIAKERPFYAVFRDACFSNDAAVANLEELFKTFSSDTIRKVI